MSIQSELTRLTDAKAAIKTAIEGKGVTVPSGTLLDGMAALIESIESGVSGVWCGSVTLVSGTRNLVVSPVVGDELYNAVEGNKVIGIALETGHTEDKTNRNLGGGGITNANNREFDIGVYYSNYNNKYSPVSNDPSKNFSPKASSTGVYSGGSNTTYKYVAGKTFIWVIATIDVGVTE